MEKLSFDEQIQQFEFEATVRICHGENIFPELLKVIPFTEMCEDIYRDPNKRREYVNSVIEALKIPKAI